ncbi:T9SS type A sorting domain-containing protein [Epilithonimonas sp.]|uniref:T9SS type A sorting domain-containing protein n=1 Tax=Epilithonimonas sp. TaxID=2894511 RepID=UPI0028A080F8|nr:T9SS type A sorting domain-containing protein [Epilithonimonas sp.]
MKKLYTLLFSFLWLFGLSQNPVLFNRNWKVEKIIVNNNAIDAPADSSGYFINFHNATSFSYYSKLCSVNYGDATYNINSDDFVITSAKTNSNGCSGSIANFDSNYALFFTKYEIPAVPNKITYEIEQIPIGYKLTLMNIDGDQIIYSFHSPSSNLTSQIWTISSLDINNIHYNKPSQYGGGNTAIDAIGFLNTSYFNTGQGSIGFYSDNKFTVLSLGITLAASDDFQVNQFDGLYLGNFFEAGGYNYPYSYDVSSDGEVLTITKYNGDIATYTRRMLRVSEISKLNIKVYPNPATDYIIVENLKTNSNIELIDSSGKLIKTISNKVSKTEINIKNLPSGIYFLKVDGQSVQKIIKK